MLGDASTLQALVKHGNSSANDPLQSALGRGQSGH